MKIMVSACLLGENCRYDGGNNRSPELLRLLSERLHRAFAALDLHEVVFRSHFLPLSGFRNGHSPERKSVSLRMIHFPARLAKHSPATLQTGYFSMVDLRLLWSSRRFASFSSMLSSSLILFFLPRLVRFPLVYELAVP